MRPAQKMTEYLANINRIQGAESCKGGACGASGGIQIPNRSQEGTLVVPSAADRPWPLDPTI